MACHLRNCTSPRACPEKELPISSWSSTMALTPLSSPASVNASHEEKVLGLPSTWAWKSAGSRSPFDCTDLLSFLGKLLSR